MVVSEEAVMLSSPKRAAPSDPDGHVHVEDANADADHRGADQYPGEMRAEGRYQCQPDRSDHETDRPGYHRLALAAAVQPCRERCPD